MVNLRINQKQSEHIRLKADGHDGSFAVHYRTPLTFLEGMFSDKAKEERPSTGPQQIHSRRSDKISRSTNHERSALPQLALKPIHVNGDDIKEIFLIYIGGYKEHLKMKSGGVRGRGEGLVRVWGGDDWERIMLWPVIGENRLAITNRE
ncbi:hypothetical protein Tco_1275195 [Tanacetum coccineum]